MNKDEVLKYKEKLLEKYKKSENAFKNKVKGVSSLKDANPKSQPPAKLAVTIENAINEIVKKNINSKDISKFVAVEFLEIYKGAGGRKKLIKYFKENPKELVSLLKSVANITTDLTAAENAKKDDSSSSQGNRGAVIQFIGVTPPQNNKKDKDVVTVDVNDVIDIIEPK